jgi:hypothetical protein
MPRPEQLPACLFTDIEVESILERLESRAHIHAAVRQAPGPEASRWVDLQDSTVISAVTGLTKRVGERSLERRLFVHFLH